MSLVFARESLQCRKSLGKLRFLHFMALHDGNHPFESDHRFSSVNDVHGRTYLFSRDSAAGEDRRQKETKGVMIEFRPLVIRKRLPTLFSWPSPGLQLEIRERGTLRHSADGLA